MNQYVRHRYIVLDTNYLFQTLKTPDYQSLEYAPELANQKRHIEESGEKEMYTFLIPEICIKEYFARKAMELSDKVKNLKKLMQDMSTYGMLIQEAQVCDPDEYFRSFRNMLYDRLAADGFRIIPMCSVDYFHSIIDDAISKKPPFEGKDKQSDKGFKDTLIWYSILQYAMVNKGTYYLTTNDNIFHINQIYFLDAFYEETKCRLHIQKSVSEMQIGNTQEQAETSMGAHHQKRSVRYTTIDREQTFLAPDGHVVMKANYHWPVVLEDNVICNTIKADMDQLLERKFEKWRTVSADYQEEQFVAFDWITEDITFIEKYNKDGKFSFALYSYFYSGGAHGMPTLEGYTYDLTSGMKLHIRDLWQETEDLFFKKLKEQIQNYYDQTKEKYGDRICDELPYKTMDEVKFYIDDRGLIVFFDVYQLGCYAEGFVEVVMQNSF